MTVDYRQYYDLEGYLFDVVGPRWRSQRWLSAPDFFAILIWKSNRAKTKMRDRLLKRNRISLEAAVHELTSTLVAFPDLRDGLRYLLAEDEWGFRLPMATAVLSVLRPCEATVYDMRVCAELKIVDPSCDFDRLGNLSYFVAIWDGYQEFVRAVRNAAPDGISLRDKDRWLWGRSFYRDLQGFVAGDNAAG